MSNHKDFLPVKHKKSSTLKSYLKGFNKFKKGSFSSSILVYETARHLKLQAKTELPLAITAISIFQSYSPPVLKNLSTSKQTRSVLLQMDLFHRPGDQLLLRPDLIVRQKKDFFMTLFPPRQVPSSKTSQQEITNKIGAPGRGLARTVLKEPLPCSPPTTAAEFLQISPWIGAQKVSAVHFGTPCTPWSVARSEKLSETKYMAAGRDCASVTVELIRLCNAYGVYWSIENPRPIDSDFMINFRKVLQD